jgi:hypothetical protein
MPVPFIPHSALSCAPGRQLVFVMDSTSGRNLLQRLKASYSFYSRKMRVQIGKKMCPKPL